MTLELLFPVYNEHNRLKNGIEGAAAYLEELCRKEEFSGAGKEALLWHFTIVDNGSTDDTPDIGRALEASFPGKVKFESIPEKGLGAAFRHGVRQADADVVGYMDIDLSTDLEALERTIRVFMNEPDTDYVNGTRFSKQSRTIGRKWYRKITSAGLVFILHSALDMKVTDALCGFTFIRTDKAKQLVECCGDDNGWFYMVELLLRAERSGMRILDLPVTFTENYDTTVNVPGTIRNYLVRIRKLRKEFKKEDDPKNRS
ncbi:MAG: glycosyltransferase [Lachnospiraceae bacterium]|nr:glycosyltransferase [Lachnospiraceae bacterium]